MRRTPMLVLMAFVATGLAGCESPHKRARATAPPAAQASQTVHSMAHVDELPERLHIPLESHGKHLFVRTGLDGVDAGLFLLDTGAAVDAIGMGLAGRLKLPAAGGGILAGVAGREEFAYRRIQNLTIGDLELDSRRLAAINLNRFNRSMGVSVNGVVGFSSLRRAPFTIDYQDATLTIYRPRTFEPPVDAFRQRLWVHHGLPLIQADFGQGRRVWMIVDTGADAEITLPAHYMEQWPDIVSVPMGGPGQVAGIGGHAGHLSTWLRNVKVLGVDLRHVPVNFEKYPGDDEGNKPTVGRIGHRLLENFRLTFAPNRGAIWAQFRPRLQSQVDASPLPFQQVRLLLADEDETLLADEPWHGRVASVIGDKPPPHVHCATAKLRTAAGVEAGDAARRARSSRQSKLSRGGEIGDDDDVAQKRRGDPRPHHRGRRARRSRRGAQVLPWRTRGAARPGN